jgi:hypothetical protein
VIFGLFGRKGGAARDTDRIWRGSAQRIAGVAREAKAASRVMVVAHFRSTLEALAAALGSSRIYTDRFGGSHRTSLAFSKADGVAVALAQALPSPGKTDAKSGEEALVLVAEHHFLPAEDDRILAYCGGLPFPCRVRFHESLDAPLLGMFGGENLLRMMATLGMPEDESIEHAMVDRSIRSAQEKIAASGPGDRPAASAAEWAQLNLRAAPKA